MVKIYRMSSGEQILGKVNEDESNEKKIVIDKPLAIEMMLNPQDQNSVPQVTFLPYAVYAQDRRITIYANQIAVEMDADVKVAEEYERIVSEIARPEKPGIITPGEPMPQAPNADSNVVDLSKLKG